MDVKSFIINFTSRMMDVLRELSVLQGELEKILEGKPLTFGLDFSFNVYVSGELWWEVKSGGGNIEVYLVTYEREDGGKYAWAILEFSGSFKKAKEIEFSVECDADKLSLCLHVHDANQLLNRLFEEFEKKIGEVRSIINVLKTMYC